MLPSPTADPMAARMKTVRDENAPRCCSVPEGDASVAMSTLPSSIGPSVSLLFPRQEEGLGAPASASERGWLHGRAHREWSPPGLAPGGPRAARGRATSGGPGL